MKRAAWMASGDSGQPSSSRKAVLIFRFVGTAIHLVGDAIHRHRPGQTSRSTRRHRSAARSAPPVCAAGDGADPGMQHPSRPRLGAAARHAEERAHPVSPLAKSLPIAAPICPKARLAPGYSAAADPAACRRRPPRSGSPALRSALQPSCQSTHAAWRSPGSGQLNPAASDDRTAALADGCRPGPGTLPRRSSAGRAGRQPAPPAAAAQAKIALVRGSARRKPHIEAKMDGKNAASVDDTGQPLPPQPLGRPSSRYCPAVPRHDRWSRPAPSSSVTGRLPRSCSQKSREPTQCRTIRPAHAQPPPARSAFATEETQRQMCVNPASAPPPAARRIPRTSTSSWRRPPSALVAIESKPSRLGGRQHAPRAWARPGADIVQRQRSTQRPTG